MIIYPFSRYQSSNKVHENSPHVRARAVANGFGPTQRAVKAFFRRPPFNAVRALLFSHGYVMCGNNREQAPKWEYGKLSQWVPFQVTHAGLQCTRWVRARPGHKMEFSDGTDVPLTVKLHYSIAMMKKKAAEP